jgi:hypothetical protein
VFGCFCRKFKFWSETRGQTGRSLLTCLKWLDGWPTLLQVTDEFDPGRGRHSGSPGGVDRAAPGATHNTP